MPLDPAIRAAMRDSRAEFDNDELDRDVDYDPAAEEIVRAQDSIAVSRFLTESEADDLLDDDLDDELVEREVKVKNPNLSNRLPREDFAPAVPFDDRPPLMERCAEVLGDRFKETRLGYLLDGKPANTDKVVAAAGLLFKDEEPIERSPPTRRRKRAKKF